MIWVVSSYHYSESTTVALFSSKSAAEAWVAARHSDRWSGFRVEDEPLVLDAEVPPG